MLRSSRGRVRTGTLHVQWLTFTSLRDLDRPRRKTMETYRLIKSLNINFRPMKYMAEGMMSNHISHNYRIFVITIRFSLIREFHSFNAKYKLQISLSINSKTFEIYTTSQPASRNKKNVKHKMKLNETP